MSTIKHSRKKAAGEGKALTRPQGEAHLSAGNREIRLTEEERRRMVAEAAYYRALRRGFTAGGEVDDWLAAEREINQKLTAAGGAALSPKRVRAPAAAGARPRPAQ